MDQCHVDPLHHPQVQVRVHAAAAEDQLGPRDAPVQHVRLEDAPKTPLLQMLDTELFVETHPARVGVHAVA